MTQISRALYHVDNSIFFIQFAGAKKCDFESDFCQWTQDALNDFDFVRNNGPSQTNNTGPNHDYSNGIGKLTQYSSTSFKMKVKLNIQSNVAISKSNMPFHWISRS